MVKKIKSILFPIQYQEHANVFKQAKKDNLSHYIYQNQRYRITKKQSFYCWFYKNELILACIAVGLSARIYCINNIITIFIRALIGAIFGIVVSAIGLRFFVKEANRNID